MVTQNCIECALNLHRREATSWSGYVVFFDDFRKKKVLAGFCNKHKHSKLPHHREICASVWCFGLWTGEMGLLSEMGDRN